MPEVRECAEVAEELRRYMPTLATALRARIADHQARPDAPEGAALDAGDGGAAADDLREEVAYWRRDAAGRMWASQTLMQARRKEGRDDLAFAHRDALRAAVCASEEVQAQHWHHSCELCGKPMLPGEATYYFADEGISAHDRCAVDGAADDTGAPDPSDADWLQRTKDGRSALSHDDEDPAPELAPVTGAPSRAPAGLREAAEAVVANAVRGWPGDSVVPRGLITDLSAALDAAIAPDAKAGAAGEEKTEVDRLRAEVERLTQEADGEFVQAAIRIMQANPGFDWRDYQWDGVTADDFEAFFTEDMNEAWRQVETLQERVEKAEAEVKRIAASGAAPVDGMPGVEAPPSIRDALVALGIDTPVANAITSGLDEAHRGQPEWLWYDHDSRQHSFGRWAKVAGAAPYIRGDIATRLGAAGTGDAGRGVDTPSTATPANKITAGLDDIAEGRFDVVRVATPAAAPAQAPAATELDAGLRQTLTGAKGAIDRMRRGLREGCTYRDRLLSIGELDAVSDLIRDALAAPSSDRGGATDGWRDIATAPKDGTLYLVFGLDTDGHPEIAVAFWRAQHGTCWIAPTGWERVHPTHWRPLPAPPTTSTTTGTEGRDHG